MPDRFGDKVRLSHVYDAIETIEKYISDSSFESFIENSMMQDACIRQLQVIGESWIIRSILTPQIRKKKSLKVGSERNFT